jgi:hypothetical protein
MAFALLACLLLARGTALSQLKNPRSRPIGLYWTNDPEGIFRAALDGERVEPVAVVPKLTGVDGLGIDRPGGKLYWSIRNRAAVGEDKIQVANLDGTGAKDLVTQLTRVGDIALDLANKKIYWSSLNLQKIQRSNLDGTGVEDVIGGLTLPDELALDPAGGMIYWTDSGAATVNRATLDGKEHKVLIEGLAEFPMGIALDLPAKRLYFATQGGRILRTNLDGQEQETLVEDPDGADGLALDLTARRMYWMNPQRISRVTLEGKDKEVLVSGHSPQFGSLVLLPFETAAAP